MSHGGEILMLAFFSTSLGRAVIWVAVAAAAIAMFFVWLGAHDLNVANKAREGYVQQAELTAEKTKTAKAELDAANARKLADEANKIADTAAKDAATAWSKYNDAVKTDTGPDGGTWGASDDQWLHQH